ncbi:hypothetical protein [Coprobacter secundus]|uniref:Uncharacterized protein n=1 Tax=Coprobacter secundus subsp. similis TaxID=2751153 RepID=A0A7G1HYJ3_9BACT|nr:hypothetical protein [Coprobacter secundus]BCI63504.1 hypothetical protein Cop2CBH44_18570 [Coprobacter secundus subsp. similis]CCY38992.1 putative uncharacterized protein [Tannerella sp. CAG:118]
MKESISSRLFYFSRNQRFAVGILLLLILGFLVFRFWMQESETVTESVQEYEQFQSEIEAFKSQLETKPLSSKTKIQKKKNLPSSDSRVQPIRVIPEDAESNSIILLEKDDRKVIPADKNERLEKMEK